MNSYVYDAFIALPDGMNSGIEPALLKESSYALGINVSSRGGLLHTRSGFVRDQALAAGAFQGAGRWSLNSGDRLVYVVAGVLYSVFLDTGVVLSHGAVFVSGQQCFFCQADRYMIVRDGTSTPVVLEEVDGVAGVRSPATVQIPAGTVMAYVHGRVHNVPRYLPSTTDNGRPYLLSGDITDPIDPGACLRLTETDYLNEGGAHGLPMEMGYINGLSVLRNSPSGTGYGPLIVMAKRGLSAFDVSVPRSEWKNQQIGQVLFFDSGTESPWSPVQVNDDLLYRSQDGVRSLKYTTSVVAGSSGVLSNPSQSSEVDNYMVPEPRAALAYVSTAFVDNQFFVTVGASDAAPTDFQGLVCLDTAYVGAFHTAIPPMYNGLWQIENQKIRQVLSAYKSSRLTVYVITDQNELWHLDDDAVLDNDAVIRSRLITRCMSFGDLVNLKRLQCADMWVSDLYHDTTISVYYRPTGYPYWSLLGTKNVHVPAGGDPQRRRSLHFEIDRNTQACDPTNGESLRSAQSFQFALEMSGHLQIDGFRATAVLVAEPPSSSCDDGEDEVVPLVPGDSAGIELGDYL